MDDKETKRLNRKIEESHRYRVRLKHDLVRAYGEVCDVCSVMGELTPVCQEPLPPGTRKQTAYMDARQRGYPEGLYKLYCELHHPTRPVDPDVAA